MTWKVLLAAMWVAQLADAVTTVVGVRAGMTELNPFVLALVDPGSWHQMLALKVGAAAVITLCILSSLDRGRTRMAFWLLMWTIGTTAIAAFSNWAQWMMFAAP